MANNRFEFQENHIYHVYNRGFLKANIFFSIADFERFYRTVIRYQNEFPEVKVLSYSFLPNHFHFVIQQTKTGFFISHFMHKVQVAHAMYLKKLFKTGLEHKPVFEGRFKAKLIETDEYLHQCLAYVNFNPVKHKLVKNIEDYPYTSYHQILRGKDGIQVIGDYGNSILVWKDIELTELEF